MIRLGQKHLCEFRSFQKLTIFHSNGVNNKGHNEKEVFVNNLIMVFKAWDSSLPSFTYARIKTFTMLINDHFFNEVFVNIVGL